MASSMRYLTAPARAGATSAACAELVPSPPDPELAGLGLAGLSNETGEYNCFLNVTIQCLWHCSEFRAAVEAWPPEFYGADPVVAALHQLFGQFAEQQRQRRQAGRDAAARGSSRQRSVVNPTGLREALAALPGKLFEVGGVG